MIFSQWSLSILLISSLFHYIIRSLNKYITKFYEKQPITNDNKSNNNTITLHGLCHAPDSFCDRNRSVLNSVPESCTRLTDTCASFWYQMTGTSFCCVCHWLNNNSTNANVYGAVIMARPLLEFTQFIRWMQTGCQAVTNPQTKPTGLGCSSPVDCWRLLLLLSPKADTHFTVPWRVEGT